MGAVVEIRLEALISIFSMGQPHSALLSKNFTCLQQNFKQTNSLKFKQRDPISNFMIGYQNCVRMFNKVCFYHRSSMSVALVWTFDDPREVHFLALHKSLHFQQILCTIVNDIFATLFSQSSPVLATVNEVMHYLFYKVQPRV